MATQGTKEILNDTKITGDLDVTGTLTSGSLSISGITTAGQLTLESTQAASDAIVIDASDTAGGIDMDAGTGGIAVNATNGVIAINTTNTATGIEIGTATSAVPISIGHTTSETTVNDNLTVTGTITGNTIPLQVNSGSGSVSLTTPGGLMGIAVTDVTGANTFTARTSTTGTLVYGADVSGGGLTLEPTSTGVVGTLNLGVTNASVVGIGASTSETTVNDNLNVAGDIFVTGTKIIRTTGPQDVYCELGFGGAQDPTLFLNAEPDAGAKWRVASSDGSNAFSINSDTNTGTITLGDSTDKVTITGTTETLGTGAKNTTTAANGALNSQGDIQLYNSTASCIRWAPVGVGAPSLTEHSNGTKVLHFPVATGTFDYASGIEASFLWHSSASGYKWYCKQDTTAKMTLSETGLLTTTGGFTLNSGSGAISLTTPGGENGIAVSDSSGVNLYTLRTNATRTLVKGSSVNGGNLNLDATTGTAGTLSLNTAVSGSIISIGHATSETTVNDNLTVSGDLEVTGSLTRWAQWVNTSTGVSIGGSTDLNFATNGTLSTGGLGTAVATISGTTWNYDVAGDYLVNITIQAIGNNLDDLQSFFINWKIGGGAALAFASTNLSTDSSNSSQDVTGTAHLTYIDAGVTASTTRNLAVGFVDTTGGDLFAGPGSGAKGIVSVTKL